MTDRETVMTDDRLTPEQARDAARTYVRLVRERGFRNEVPFTDAQVWQAIIESRDYRGNLWDNAAVRARPRDGPHHREMELDVCVR